MTRFYLPMITELLEKIYGRHRRAGASANGGADQTSDLGAGATRAPITVTVGAASPDAADSVWSFQARARERTRVVPPQVPRAPLEAGELVGWRAWFLARPSLPQMSSMIYYWDDVAERIVDYVPDDQQEKVAALRLYSLAHDHAWEPGATQSGDLDKVVQVYLDKTVFGGVYAHSTFEECFNDKLEILFSMKVCEPPWCLNNLDRSIEVHAVVFGSIWMWGEVMEHARGWRAQYAAVRSLDELYGAGNLDELRARYCEKEFR